MAIIGLKNLFYAKCTQDDEQGIAYSTPTKMGGAIQMAVNPQIAKNTLYADDAPFATASSITDITVTLDVADLTAEVIADLGGHTIGANGEIIYGASDSPPYVAILGESEKQDGSTRYFKLLKGKFNETQETIQTKGEKVEFTTPKLEGSFVARKHDKKWKIILDSTDATVANSWYASVD